MARPTWTGAHSQQRGNEHHENKASLLACLSKAGVAGAGDTRELVTREEPGTSTAVRLLDVHSEINPDEILSGFQTIYLFLDAGYRANYEVFHDSLM